MSLRVFSIRDEEASPIVACEFGGKTRYFRRATLAALYEKISYLVANARLVIDPEEQKVAEEYLRELRRCQEEKGEL